MIRCYVDFALGGRTEVFPVALVYSIEGPLLRVQDEHGGYAVVGLEWMEVSDE